MKDYIKNLTASSDVSVIYTYDNVGDTQGKGLAGLNMCRPTRCLLDHLPSASCIACLLTAALLVFRGPMVWSAGEENFIAKTYDYVVTDMPLTQTQLKQCNRCSLLLLGPCISLSRSAPVGRNARIVYWFNGVPTRSHTMCRPVLQIPYGVNALGATHTLPNVPSGVLHLDAHALAGIYQCNITQWDHPAIAALNPNIRCDLG